MDDSVTSLRAALSNRYALERELSHGPAALVFLAYDLKLQRQVVLKALSRSIAAVIGRDRFLREIGIAAKLSHPHILPLFESNEAQGWLYFTMPYIAGGTLEDRLASHGPLPVADALSITAQIAEALEHSHANQVIHRDIKPANILLANSHAFLADFGIARPHLTAEEARLTETGDAVGTPSYMPPEQAQGRSDLDGRSDEYSLAAVLYEMLVGLRVFQPDPAGPALKDPFARLRTRRPELPTQIVAALERALSPDRKERFATITDFAKALGNDPVTPGKRLRALLVVATALALAFAGWWLVRKLSVIGPKMDATRFAVLPFVYDSGLPRLQERARLRDALGQWTGISLSDEAHESELVGASGIPPLFPGAAQVMARKLGAGSFIWGTVSRVGDSMRVYGAVYDTRKDGRLVRAVMPVLPLDGAGAPVLLQRMAEALLIPSEAFEATGMDPGTRSVEARTAFVAGEQWRTAWDLPAADSAFARASRADPDYARSHLWLGLVRLWQRTDPALWRPAATQAEAGQDRLQPQERPMAGALAAAARDDGGSACHHWRDLTRESPRDFVVWYGWAQCQLSDTALVRDGSSPSGWRFRNSYHSGLQAFYRAVRLSPSLVHGFQADGYAALRALLRVDGYSFRLGRVREVRFAGFPEWEGDTLAMVPYPIAQAPIEDHRTPAATARAIQHQREAFREITALWVSASPGQAEPLEGLAVALDLLGQPAASDTLRRAYSLLSRPADRVRVGMTLVGMEIKRALPDDLPRLARARQLADSLLDMVTADPAADQLAGAALALLTGRASLGARLLSQPSAARRLRADPQLIPAAPRLLGFAALGGPRDSLRLWEDKTLAAIDGMRIASERTAARSEWLARAATLTFPAHVFRTLPAMEATGDPLLDAQAAAFRGDSGKARDRMSDIAERRRSVRPEDATLDAVYPEAELLRLLGDSTGAERWLAASLEALPAKQTDALLDPIQAASLGRAVALRADLAAHRGDTALARRWRQALQVLWSSADPFLRPTRDGYRDRANH